MVYSPERHREASILNAGEQRMPRCFMIQPLDGKQYDKRYEDVFEPAIKDAGLEPYRVDRDLSASILIDEIEQGIKASDACLAEISTDNPNVWFELGYAIASKREVVLLCSDERETPFPFDVRHRQIIKYATESPRDFEEARSKITARLEALLKKREELGRVVSMTSVSRVEGLEQYEIAGLVAVAQEVNHPEAGINIYMFRQHMDRAGFTRLAGTIALKSLLERRMLELFEDEDYSGETFDAVKVTSEGMRWLLENKEKLTLSVSDESPQGNGITDHDVPF